MLVRDYDHYEHEDALNFFEEVDPQKEQKIMNKVDELARIYRKGIDAQDSEIIIPFGEILGIKIDGQELNDAEIQVAYDYIEKQGYKIRGNDMTAENELNCYSRYAVNKTLKLAKPYPKRTQKRKLRILAEYKRIIDAYESLDIMHSDDISILDAYKQVLQKYQDLREDLILHNLRLAYTIVNNRYWKYDLPIEDKYAIAFMQVMKGLDNYIKKFYEGSSQYALSTYIINQQSFERIVADDARTIRLPAQVAETVHKINSIRNKLYLELNREPNIEDLAFNMWIPADRIREILQICDDVISYDEIETNEQERLYENGYYDEGIIKDSDSTESQVNPINVGHIPDDPFALASYSSLQEDLRKIIDSLPDREKKVIVMRFGFDDNYPKHLNEVAKSYGVPRERIRQIESKTLAKLRHPSYSSKFVDYLKN